MRDWSKLVREQLNLAGLSAEEQKEIIAELASHFDDLCEGYRMLGLSESEAAKRAIKEVTDWRDLSKTIQRAKREEGIMNDRIKHFWLPGFVSLTASVLLFAAFVWMGLHPYIYHARYASVVFYFPWLATLPLCGAASAYLSRRAGGKSSTCLICSLFPAATILVSLSCIVFFAHIFGTDGFVSPPAFAIVATTWILLPGALLLLGATPFLYAGNLSTQARLTSGVSK